MKTNVNLIYRPIAALKEYENNPRENDGAVDAVATSIREFGFKIPMVIDAQNVIICGHTRLKAAQKLGMTDVPCIIADDLSEEQIRAFRLADNKCAELAEWNQEKLLGELQRLSMDMDVFGFTENAIQEIKDKILPECPEEQPAEVSEPRAKLGDVFILGEHRLMCGDSTSPEDLSTLVDGQVVDLLLTDPPYNIDYTGATPDAMKIKNDSFATGAEFRKFLSSAFLNVNRHLKSGGAFYVWHADSERINVQGACEDAGWKIRQTLIWVKNAFTLGRQDYQWQHESCLHGLTHDPCIYGWKEGAGHYFTDLRTETTVLKYDKPVRNDIHPTMKPVDLISELVRNSSKPGECVLDVFGGGGSTLIACEMLGRKCLMMELDPKYCDAIVTRWEAFTGKCVVLQ